MKTHNTQQKNEFYEKMVKWWASATLTALTSSTADNTVVSAVCDTYFWPGRSSYLLLLCKAGCFLRYFQYKISHISTINTNLSSAVTYRTTAVQQQYGGITGYSSTGISHVHNTNFEQSKARKQNIRTAAKLS